MRLLLGMTAGVAVISGIALLCLVPLFLLLGPEHALAGNSLEFNTLWIGIAMVVCLTAASIGGWIAHRVAGSIGAVLGLIAIVVAFGLADAGYHQLLAPTTAVARGQLGWFELLVGLREPLWYDLTLPVLMGIFIWIAGSSRDIEQRPIPRRG
ncbi:hypothetical protein [Thioalkalivibrio thiocyanodenitrificans]|uniref:hypothetical protein n=1 Tax=Thioalkalivibrio thiocyanodenitrificans TaxID=243063 RepID=UPI00035D30DE|nr:hypothetical protein [Thioalkalivibrio thiocyanodenitrificans]